MFGNEVLSESNVLRVSKDIKKILDPKLILDIKRAVSNRLNYTSVDDIDFQVSHELLL